MEINKKRSKEIEYGISHVLGAVTSLLYIVNVL